MSGQGPCHHAKVGDGPLLALPTDAMLFAVDDAHRFYLTAGHPTRLRRYTATFEPDLAITLDGAREVTVGRDGNIYAWLFSSPDIEVCPEGGGASRSLDPKEDYTAENLFCYTYAMEFDRHGNLWTYNGQGDKGSTIISADKSEYVRYASKELGPEFDGCQPVPSPWHDEVYFLTDTGHLAVFDVRLTGWKAITPDIHR